MQINNFDWDEWNVEHVIKHNVTPQEVEEACYNQSLNRKTKGGLYISYGQTDAGRYLFVILRYKGGGKIYVVTARSMTENEQRYYRKRR